MKQKSAVTKLKPSPRSKDLPATQGMLHLVRTELKEEMKAGFHKMDAKFEKVFSEFARVSADVARIGLLVEEQNSRNQVVLEGLTGLYHRQDRVELRADEAYSLIQGVSARSNR